MKNSVFFVLCNQWFRLIAYVYARDLGFPLGMTKKSKSSVQIAIANLACEPRAYSTFAFFCHFRRKSHSTFAFVIPVGNPALVLLFVTHTTRQKAVAKSNFSISSLCKSLDSVPFCSEVKTPLHGGEEPSLFNRFINFQQLSEISSTKSLHFFLPLRCEL